MKHKFLFAILSCFAVSSCSAGAENGLVYPHTNSPYLFQKPKEKNAQEIKKEYKTKSSEVNLSDVSIDKTNTYKQTHLIRERIFISAPFNEVWQALLKFTELNNYHIKRSSIKEGLLEVDISSNVAQYYSTSLPTQISEYTKDKSALNGIVAWNFYMVIFATQVNNKTLLEFIPKYYIITSRTHNAEYLVQSNGHFENNCVDFIKKEIASY
ncbi:hypothetical protein DESAMIL20_2047 [Desulfurella amilsii]|uniref:Lipoprotein n=1 Tax=Desulfurella amilsii TaxID=1562698 RepID=A0A1X4XU99_9BACT|nr:hypothetical protein [Desulfurella amilsii]OSS41109.1 hypothetical protein DESAMIL20_2047 [Desulfurella amilsii]